MLEILLIYGKDIFLCLAILALGLRFRSFLWRHYRDWLIKTKSLHHLATENQIQVYAAACGIVSTISLLLFGLNIFVVLILVSLSIFFGPRAILASQRRQYMSQINASLQESLQMLAASLRAGITLPESLQNVAKNGPKPIAGEFSHALKEYHFGVGLIEALHNIRIRVRNNNAHMAISAMAIGSELGGNLPLILQRIAHTIRERIRVEGKLMALTSQGRTQAMLLCGAPPLVYFGMYFWDPSKTALLTGTFPGQCLLLLAIVLEVVGILFTKRILDLDV